ncbi:hypothetical protein FHS14_002565 [Paenibacillus baekrokdamisoli]|nr:hypothetical protein [Paenibacillus baekrokdamisoli]
MRTNRFTKIFIWLLIAVMLLSTLFISIGWIFE